MAGTWRQVKLFSRLFQQLQCVAFDMTELFQLTIGQQRIGFAGALHLYPARGDDALADLF